MKVYDLNPCVKPVKIRVCLQLPYIAIKSLLRIFDLTTSYWIDLGLQQPEAMDSDISDKMLELVRGGGGLCNYYN